ncbi:hypothetical protein LOTGIDRAFT_239455 [Lottia gigantea]|uniref:Uncharacterized protein n=1 Tax=Lottia gigantea TaxID=225164 RepID=V4AEA2_LOTGI|nr:hypothetical protein LOTGIDRAFT_239455 [Lottia gigantea]ESO95217.1 hypothetical protein LOTGIDRAFT_239455 [Lottia gigantea]
MINVARVPRTKELVFSFNRTLHLEVNTVMVEHKCPKGDSWNEARCKQIELHYTDVKCLWCGTEARKVRKGKWSGIGDIDNTVLGQSYVMVKVIETIDIKIDDTESLVVIS